MHHLSHYRHIIVAGLLAATHLLFISSVQAFPEKAMGGGSGELVFIAKVGSTQVEEKLALPFTTQAGTLNQKVTVGEVTAVLKDYLPHASFKPVIKKTDGGAPVIELTLASKNEKLVQYLDAADPKRDELGTTIADFSLKTFATEAEFKAGFQTFQMAQMQAPVLKLVAENGKTYSVMAIKGTKKEITEPKATVEILEFMPHFQSNQGGGAPVNGSSKMINPAVKYAITADGKTIESWSFARFPDFNMNKNQKSPFKCQLSSLIEKEKQVAQYVIAECKGNLTLWTLKEKKATSEDLKAGQKVTLINDITFEVSKFEPSGTLVDTVTASQLPRDPAALKVELTMPDKSTASEWIPMGKTVKVTAGNKELLMTFGPKKTAKPGGMDGAHGMKSGMGSGSMPKNHPPMGGSGMGGGQMPKNHPPMGGSGMGGSGMGGSGMGGGQMPKNHPPMGGSGMGGGQMPKNHPPMNQPKEEPKEEKK